MSLHFCFNVNNRLPLVLTNVATIFHQYMNRYANAPSRKAYYALCYSYTARLKCTTRSCILDMITGIIKKVRILNSAPYIADPSGSFDILFYILGTVAVVTTSTLSESNRINRGINGLTIQNIYDIACVSVMIASESVCGRVQLLVPNDVKSVLKILKESEFDNRRIEIATMYDEHYRNNTHLAMVNMLQSTLMISQNYNVDCMTVFTTFLTLDKSMQLISPSKIPRVMETVMETETKGTKH